MGSDRGARRSGFAALIAFAAVATLGLLGVVLAAAADRPASQTLDVEHDRVAATLVPGERVCQGSIRPDGAFGAVSLWTGGPRRGSLAMAVRTDDGTVGLGAGTVRTQAGAGQATIPLHRAITPAGAGRVIQICLQNRGGTPVTLAGDQPSPISGVLHAHGRPTGLAVALELRRSHPESLLGSLSAIARRAARFRASWVGEWTFWAVLGGLIVALGLTGFAVAGAVRTNAAGAQAPARRLPPAPLLAAATILAVSWAIVVPAWQSPDELDHSAYVESLAARGELPGDPHRPGWSSAQRAAVFAIGAQRVAGRAPQVQPNPLASAERMLRLRSRHLSRSDGGGPLTAASNPPLYYAIAAVGYLIAGGGDALDRLTAERLLTALLLPLTAVGVWLLAGELLGPPLLPRLAAAGAVAAQPMLAFVDGSVNPDALMVTLWTFALWLAVRIVRRGVSQRDALALALLTAAAVLTKATSYALLPAVLVALAVGARRHAADGRGGSSFGAGRWSARGLPPALAALVLPLLAWLAVAGAGHRRAVNALPSVSLHRVLRPGRIADYLTQFYGPQLPGMKRFPVPSLPPPSFHYVHLVHLRAPARLLAWPAYTVWARGGWAAFGWTEVSVAGWVVGLLAVVSAAVVVVLLAGALRAWRAGQRAVVVVLGLAVLGLLLGLHATEFVSLVAAGRPVLQGRYLLPLVGLLGLGCGIAVARLPVRAAGVLVGAGLAGLLVLQVLCLGDVLRAYYA